jgi:hypothetical protein
MTIKRQLLTHLLRNNFYEKRMIFSDKSTTYVHIANYVDVSLSAISDKQTTKTTLKWLRPTISNAKRTLLGVFHMIKGKHLQS